MKGLFLIFVVAFAFNGILAVPSPVVLQKEGEVKGVIDGLINSTLNAILENLPEVITVGEIDIPLPDEGILTGGGLNLTSLTINGVKSLVATEITVDIWSLGLNMTVVLPSINVNLGYSIDATAASLIPLYGAGKMNFNLEDINLQIGGKVAGLTNLTLSDVKVVLHLGSAVFDLHGLINNEDFSAIVSAILNDTVAPFINDNAELISNIISPLMETIINAIMHQSSKLYQEELEIVAKEWQTVNNQ